jgi:hypothetical protein
MKPNENNIAWTIGRRGESLGDLVDVKGVGSVYAMPKPRPQLAKVYSDGVDLARYERKIAAMLDAPPNLPDIEDGDERHVQIAWPDVALRDEQGRFIGFLMPAVDLAATFELEWLLHERQARSAALLLGLTARIALAANIATTIAALHEHGHHVVDLNPGKLRFNPQTQDSAILDCDSFSIQGKAERFPAEFAQLNADYLAPEFQGQPIPPEGEEQQDRFALAVLVFQLLNFGIHPFNGIPTDDQVPTDISGRIARHCYAYGVEANPLIRPSLGSGHQAKPSALRSLFDRAFVGDGAERPSADEWATLLKTYAMPWNKCLRPCRDNAAHQHFVDLPCADCARSEQIANSADALDMSLEHVPDPMAVGVHAFGAPQSGDEIVPPSAAWHAPAPIETILPPVEPPKVPPKGVVTAIKMTAALVLVAICVKAALTYEDRQAAHAASRQHYAGEPVDPPGAPRPDPDLVGFPSMEKEEALTEGFVRAAASAIAKDNRSAWESAISELRRRIPAHQASPSNGYQGEFATFSAGFTPEHYSERERQKLIGDLHQALLDNHFDDEAASELGWLSLVGGERDAARKYYTHAIWVNPDRANAWYGFAVIAGNEEQTAGALAAAELLTPDPAMAQKMRDTFPRLLLQLCGIKPQSFAMLESRARVIADKNRPVVPPPGASTAASAAASPK